MARLYKRPDRGNTYWYDFIDPRTGRRRRVNTGCTSKAEAEAFVQDLWARLKGLVQDTETVYLSQALGRVPGRSRPGPEVGLAASAGPGARHPHPGRHPPSGHHARPALRLSSEATEGKDARGTPVQPSTVRRELLYLSSLMTFAVKRGWMEDNPVRKVEKPRESPPRQDCFTPEEIRRLLNTPTTPPLRMAFLLSLMMGLRRGEILRLRRSDVLLGRRTHRHPKR
jgi:hypothetical protein